MDSLPSVPELIAALDASERRRQAILDTVLDAVITIDSAGTIETVNAAVERVFGYRPDELIGRNVSLLMPEPHQSAHDDYIQAYEQTHIPKVIGIGRLIEGLRKNGTTFPAELTVGKTELDGRPIYTGVVQDISIRDTAQRELVEMRERLELAISGTSDGIWDWIPGEERVYESPRMREMLGITDHPHLHMRDLLSPQDLAATRRAVREHLDRGVAFDQEFLVTLPDGRTKWFRSRGKALRNEAGEAIRMAGALIDVTEAVEARQKLQDMADSLTATIHARTTELRHANVNLERAARAKDSFLASMSHELRTPLNAVLGLTEALLEDVYGPMNGEQRRALTTIDGSGKHLLALISDILDLAKIQSGRLELDNDPVSVRDLVHASVSVVRQAAEKKSLHLAVTEVDSRVVMTTDGRRLKQVLINLLSNAVKFTPEEGRVILDVRPRREENIIEFRIEDTGIGVATDRLEEIFEPFRQVDSKLSRAYEGTGLGLALVRELVDALGGSVSVRSELGRGSEFQVRLPWDQPATIDIPHLSEQVERRALIVEDSEADARRLERSLHDIGFSTRTIRDTSLALTQIQEYDPDVLFLDVILPDESGWEFLERVREQHRDLAVICVSILEDRARSLSQGALMHLVKPFEATDLRRAINRIPTRPADDRKQVVGEAPIEHHRHPILLAEDNEANILAISGYLRRQGFPVLVARNGAEAVELARKEKPSVILMDIQMPLMDGMEAMRRIRTGEIGRVPIIALTALAMRGDRERFLEAGADDYMSKPVRLAELLATITAHLRRDA